MLTKLFPSPPKEETAEERIEEAIKYLEEAKRAEKRALVTIRKIIKDLNYYY